jgi:uncharacterized protein YyaL (SSP411 family)
LLIHHLFPYYEIVFTGDNALENLKKFEKIYIPGKVVSGGLNNSGSIPILGNKEIAGKSLIYVCENFTCQQPVEDVDQALEMINHQ